MAGKSFLKKLGRKKDSEESSSGSTQPTSGATAKPATGQTTATTKPSTGPVSTSAQPTQTLGAVKGTTATSTQPPAAQPAATPSVAKETQSSAPTTTGSQPQGTHAKVSTAAAGATSSGVTGSTSHKGPRIAILFYSMYGHIYKMAVAEKQGIVSAGGSCDMFQIPETLPKDILEKMHAPEKHSDIGIATTETLKEYDAFLFGIPTRYGNFPAQWKAFWDATGGLWGSAALVGKHAGIFVSTASPQGGQELTAQNAMSTLTHHGIIFVPMGYGQAMPMLSNLDEVHGGSPWGAGTIAAGDGSRQPSELELEMARHQGKHFYQMVSRVSVS